MLNLAPCPFCGSSASIERYGARRQSTIYQCDNCSCSLETGEEFNHGAEWNRRAPIEAGNGGDGWFDIASAPKTGEIILADRAEWGDPEIVAWNDGDSAWCTGSWGWNEAPTHWRPLPARRSTPSQEGREKA